MFSILFTKMEINRKLIIMRQQKTVSFFVL